MTQIKDLSHIKIILVEPAGALNVGSVARSMKNMGLNQLILVKPHCDYLGEDGRKMAVHGIDILENAQCVATLADALAGCHKAIATTARSRSLPMTLETPVKTLPWLLEDQSQAGLIFGPEDRGLNNEELSFAQRFICIPTHSTYPSLNLAQAVTVCVYELYQATLGDHTDDPKSNFTFPRITEESASLDLLEGYYQHLEEFLLKIGYLYPHTAPVKMQKFRRLFNQTLLTTDEVTMLRGILRQAEWAINHYQQLTKNDD
jgi:tRNA/rRNA methyltransferase